VLKSLRRLLSSLLRPCPSFDPLQLPLLIACLVLAIAVPLSSRKAARDLIAEVDQRAHLNTAGEFAKRLKESVGDVSTCNVVKPFIEEIEREYTRFRLYLVGRGGLIRCSTQQGTITQTGEAAHNTPLERLIRRGVDAIPLESYDPRDPLHPKPFSAAKLTIGEEDFFLLAIITGTELLVFDRNYEALRELKPWRKSLHLLLAVIAAPILLRVLVQRWRNPPSISIPIAVKDPATTPEEHEVSFLATAVSTIAHQLVSKVGHFDSRERERRLFISGLSHDLRTPLATVRAYVDTLLKRSDLSEDEVRHHISVVTKNVNHVKSFVRQIVDASELDGISESLKRSKMNLGSSLQNVIEQHRLNAERKGIALSLSIPSSPPSVFADDMLLERAISNLVHNAIKFTDPQGTVEVSLILRESTVVISVKDSGPGIPETELTKVFEQFFRGVSHKKDRDSGFGLGLYIVRRIVEAHKGDVSVESKVGEGTTFRIQIPLS